MKFVSVKFVLKLLTVEQKATHLAWLPMMNLGIQGTTLKQKVSHRNGRLRHLWGQKRHIKFGARWKWCWQFLMIMKASFATSTHQKVELSTRSTAFKFFVGCMMWCGASYLCCRSEVTGSCTTTSPVPTRPTSSRTSWLNVRSHKCQSPPIHLTLPHVTFYIPKSENAVEGE